MKPFYVSKLMEEDAEEILGWKYEPPYDFYNSELTNEAKQELLQNTYYSIIGKNKELIGFFCLGPSAQVPSGHKFDAYNEDFLDIGIGLKPSLTGKGHGDIFFAFVLENIHSDKPLRLTVASFNERAIHLYQKFGFMKGISFDHNSTNFLIMVKTNDA